MECTSGARRGTYNPTGARPTRHTGRGRPMGVKDTLDGEQYYVIAYHKKTEDKISKVPLWWSIHVHFGQALQILVLFRIQLFAYYLR